MLFYLVVINVYDNVYENEICSFKKNIMLWSDFYMWLYFFCCYVGLINNGLVRGLYWFDV